MKGVVLAEFQHMVEERFGLEMYDRLVRRCRLATDGAYTSVGKYDYRELIQLVTAFSELTDTSVSEIYRSFGHYIFNSQQAAYPQAILPYPSARELLRTIESTIHVEVRKLYPDASLPTFYFEHLEHGAWAVTYDSTFPFADMAEGLMEAVVDYFREPWEITREDIEDNGTAARFTFTAREPVGQCPKS